MPLLTNETTSILKDTFSNASGAIIITILIFIGVSLAIKYKLMK